MQLLLPWRSVMLAYKVPCPYGSALMVGLHFQCKTLCAKPSRDPQMVLVMHLPTTQKSNGLKPRATYLVQVTLSAKALVTLS